VHWPPQPRTLHQCKRTGSNQQHKLSLALGSLAPHTLSVNKENKRPAIFDEDEDDFVTLKKKPKVGIAMNGKCRACFLSHVWTTVLSTSLSRSKQHLYVQFMVLHH